MSATRSMFLGAGAVLVGAAALSAPATAAPDGLTADMVLSGICPGQTGDLKSVITSVRSAGMWAPLHLMDGEFRDTRKILVPYEFTVTGEGLKTRHLQPGVTYVKPGPAPAGAVTCILDGATKEYGPFQVVVSGTVHGPGTAG